MKKFRATPSRSWPRREIFLAVFAAFLSAIHRPYLKLPFHWDELGQFVPAALDLYRDGDWVPHSTLPNVHPPAVMALVALAWRVFGYSNAGTLNFRRAIGHAGSGFAGRAVLFSAGHPAGAGHRGSAGIRRGPVPARFAAVLHAVHDGAAGHARDDADGAGSAVCFWRTVGDGARPRARSWC